MQDDSNHVRDVRKGDVLGFIQLALEGRAYRDNQELAISNITESISSARIIRSSSHWLWTLYGNLTWSLRKMTGLALRIPTSGSEFKIGFHSEQDVWFLTVRLQMETYWRNILGSKRVNRQRSGLNQCSRQLAGCSGEANDTDTRSRYQSPPVTSMNMTVFSNAVSGTSQGQASPNPSADTHFIVMNGMTAWTAFTCIATMLDLACDQDSGFNICAPLNSIPPPLAPTLQQQMVPHKPYVDMLPWSSLRDRILNSQTTINEIEFIMDMASDELKVWGSTPWDPTGWEMGSNLVSKWWFLMDDGILLATNFWRAQRGEEALILAQS